MIYVRTYYVLTLRAGVFLTSDIFNVDPHVRLPVTTLNNATHLTLELSIRLNMELNAFAHSNKVCPGTRVFLGVNAMQDVFVSRDESEELWR